MLKIYEYRGLTYQFEEGHQPSGAVEVRKDEPKPETKVEKPKTKVVRSRRK